MSASHTLRGGGYEAAAARAAAHFSHQAIRIQQLEARVATLSRAIVLLERQRDDAVAQQVTLGRKLKEAQRRSRQP